MKKNYYQILQVDQKASIEVIEKVYKTLVKKYHPDLQSEENKSNNEEILKDINEAYETLSDPDKRQAYDEMLMQKFMPENQSIKNQLDSYNHYSSIENANNITNKNKKKKKSFNDYLLDFIAILITFSILLLLWQIPFIKNILSDNIIIKNISNLLQLFI